MATGYFSDWRFSCNNANDFLNTDPLLSIGGHWSASVITDNGHVSSHESTLTSTMTSNSTLFDTAQIGNGHQPGTRLMFVDGNNQDDMAVVESFNDSTGEFTLTKPLPNLSTSGTQYRITTPDRLFADIDWADVEYSDFVDYRVVYGFHRFPTGAGTIKFDIDPLEYSDGQTLEMAVPIFSTQSSQSSALPTHTDQFESWVDDSGRLTPYSGSWSAGAGGFNEYHAPRWLPPFRALSGIINFGWAYPVILRRTVKQGSSPGVASWRIQTVFEQGGTDYTSPSLVCSRLNQYGHTVTLAQDRPAWTGGGTRVTATVTGPDGSLVPLTGRYVRFDVKSGDPGTVSDQYVQTDSLGKARTVYNSPAGGGEQTADIEVTVHNPAVL